MGPNPVVPMHQEMTDIALGFLSRPVARGRYPFLFSSCGTRAPSARCPSNFPGDSCSGAFDNATVAGEINNSHTGRIQPVVATLDVVQTLDTHSVLRQVFSSRVFFEV